VVFFLTGSNTTVDHPIIGYKIHQAHRRGAKLIMVDPRHTELAEEADFWLHIKSGTDIPLINGLMHIIIKEDLHDKKFIEEWTENFGAIIQEAVASKGYYDCSKAMVVTNSFFTQQAIELARRNQVELWDRNKLVTVLLSVKNKTQQTVLDLSIQEETAVTTDYQPSKDMPQNTCALCGKPVSEKLMNYS